MWHLLLSCDGPTPPQEYPCVPTTWYRDADGDGYGDPDTTQQRCDEEDGWVATAGDCEDGNEEIPDDDEHCDVDDLDDDCDGLSDDADPDAPAPQTFCHDADGDGFGTEDDTIQGCDPTDEYLVDCSDCDDADATVSPDAVETYGDGLDTDCDGIDGTTTWADEAIWGFYDAAGWAVTPIAGGDLTGDGTASIVVASANHGSGLIYLLPEGGGTDLTPADALAIVSGTDDSGGLSGPMVVLRSGAGGDALAVSDNAGGLFLFDAPVTDLRTGESADLRLTSPSEGWGGAVYPTGDLDQDGVDDMRVIGTAADGSVPEFLVSGRERGTADLESVSFGWIDGLNGHPAGPATGSSWDVNGDGVPDVVDACTPTDVSLGGVVYVFEGPVSGALDASLAAITMEAPETGGPRFGYTLDVADLDEDGAPDVIVGAPPWNPTAIVVGRIFVYSHATDGTLQPEPSVTIEGPMGSMFGRSVLAWPSEVTQRMELFGGSNRDAAGDGRAVVYYFEALGSGVHTTTEAALALTDGADWFGDALHRSDSGALLLSDTDGTARALNITR